MPLGRVKSFLTKKPFAEKNRPLVPPRRPGVRFAPGTKWAPGRYSAMAVAQTASSGMVAVPAATSAGMRLSIAMSSLSVTNS